MITNITYSGNYVGPGFGHNSSGLFIQGKVWNALIYNNVFSAVDGTSPADGLVFCWLNPKGTTPNNVNVFNNTFVGANNATGVNFYDGFGATLTTYNCKNNLFANIGMPLVVYYWANSRLVSDYNDFYNMSPNGGLGVENANSAGWQIDLPTWQRDGGWDLHSTTNNPNLDASFIPQIGSAARGTGTNLAGLFTTDMKGSLRPPKWDMGALQNQIMPAPTNFLMNVTNVSP